MYTLFIVAFFIFITILAVGISFAGSLVQRDSEHSDMYLEKCSIEKEQSCFMEEYKLYGKQFAFLSQQHTAGVTKLQKKN